MSIDRCVDCDKLIDTDFVDDCYNETGECRCERCQETYWQNTAERVKEAIVSNKQITIEDIEYLLDDSLMLSRVLSEHRAVNDMLRKDPKSLIHCITDSRGDARKFWNSMLSGQNNMNTLLKNVDVIEYSEIEEQIQVRCQLIKEMTGTLYPSILQSEIDRLYDRLYDRLECSNGLER